MFCRNCGTEMSDTARFCPKCGNDRMGEQTPKKEKIEDNHIIFQIKPEFNDTYKLLSNTWHAIIGTFFICFAFIDIYKLLLTYNSSTLILTIIIMALYVAIKMILEKIQYNDLEYNFYTTKIEYKDGFLNKEEKELKYKYVREVTMSRNVLERLCGIGTIRIFTNASSGAYNGNNHNSVRGRNGIYIHCVADVEEKYRIIKRIIDEGSSEE